MKTIDDLKVAFEVDHKFVIEKPDGFPWPNLVYQTQKVYTPMVMAPIKEAYVPLEFDTIPTVTGRWWWFRNTVTRDYVFSFEIHNPHNTFVPKFGFRRYESHFLIKQLRTLKPFETHLTNYVKGVLSGSVR